LSRHFLFVVCGLVLLGSCQDAAPALRVVDIGVDEDSHPVGIAVLVENLGAAAKLTSARAEVDWKFLVTEKVAPDVVPSEFNYQLKPTTPNSPEVVEGSTRPIAFDFIWNTSPDPPPMLAIVHATMELTFDGGQRVESMPVTFIVRSRPDVRVDQTLGQESAGLAARVKSRPGWKSPYVKALVNPANSRILGE
jgi:hypothetical protein